VVRCLLKVAFGLVDDEFDYLHYQVIVHIQLLGDLEDESRMEHVAYFFRRVSQMQLVQDFQYVSHIEFLFGLALDLRLLFQFVLLLLDFAVKGFFEFEILREHVLQGQLLLWPCCFVAFCFLCIFFHYFFIFLFQLLLKLKLVLGDDCALWAAPFLKGSLGQEMLKHFFLKLDPPL